MSILKDEYDTLAGRNIQRIENLSDCVFSIAMTLLVLELTIPFLVTVHTEEDLWLRLLSITPKLLVFFMSFITLGLLWTGQSIQYIYIVKSDRHLNWLSIFHLMFISLIPFSTTFLSEYITFKLAIGVYWFNILLIGFIAYVHWQYAKKNNFVSLDVSDYEKVDKAIRNRIIIAQILYASAALLCFINTYLSIVVIIAIQLNYALAPSFNMGIFAQHPKG